MSSLHGLLVLLHVLSLSELQQKIFKEAISRLDEYQLVTYHRLAGKRVGWGFSGGVLQDVLGGGEAELMSDVAHIILASFSDLMP